jgi:PAS domain S-box-containing protein
VHQIELEMQNTELRQARYEVDTALEKYTDLYEFAPVGYFTLDRIGTIRGVNFAGAALLGVERSRLIGKRLSRYVAYEARSLLSEFLGKVFTSPTKEVWEVALLREGESQLFVQIEAVASTSVTECYIAVIDLSACRETERSLKSERRLAEAQSIAHIGSWEWDSISGEITGSDEITRIFGLIETSYDGFLEVVHPDDREMLDKAVQETLSHQTPYDVHYRIIRSDRISRIIHARGEAVTDGSGKTVRIIGTAQDVTEHRELEEKLENLNAELAARALELEAFNYTVAHDLRTPLSNIHGYCQVLQTFCAAQNEDFERYILEIYKATERMDRLIDTLLKFSGTLRVEMRHDTVDLSGMAQEVAASLQRTEPERQVTFRIADGINVNGDANLLNIVLVNLIGNAWKFSDNREGTVIEFGVTGKDGNPAYFVRDNGRGFDMADMDKLFVPFKRLHKSKVQGYGLGLATVERIIRRHGGRVWAEGEPGKGATFYFTL